MSRIAIIAAMAGELKPLVRGAVRGAVRERRNGADVWRWKFDQCEWVAACAGAGVDAATRAFAAAEKGGPLTAVISVGWVGALTEELETGKAYSVAEVIDARTGERFAASLRSHPRAKNKDVARVGGAEFDLPRSQRRDRGHPSLVSDSQVSDSVVGDSPGLTLVTSPRVADAAEKRRLAATYGAQLVDMEASAVARLAQMRGIPFYAIKGISDGLNDKLPDFNRFIRADGQFDMAGMVLFSILRPWHWPSLIRMGENSRKASQSICEAVLDFLDERASIRERNGYPNLKH